VSSERLAQTTSELVVKGSQASEERKRGQRRAARVEAKQTRRKRKRERGGEVTSREKSRRNKIENGSEGFLF